MRKLLSLDMSLSNTGYAISDIDSEKLLCYGELSPSKKGISKLAYPKSQIVRTRDLVMQILKLIAEHPEIEVIAVEEVNRGISRIGQKILCSLHGVLLDRMSEEQVDKVKYISSDGSDGWRSKNGLKLQLSELDRIQNKEIRKLNRRVKKGKKLPVIDIKQLACNYVNEKHGLKLDVKTRKKDSDIADAIGLNDFALRLLKNANK